MSKSTKLNCLFVGGGCAIPLFAEALREGVLMKEYTDLLRFIMETGEDRDDRTGTGVRSIFGAQMRFNLSSGFPLVTTKRVHFKSVVGELLWFLSGSTNVKDLNQHGVRIWDEWADPNGDLGPIYGKQWRSWQSGAQDPTDQISNLIRQIKDDPFSRRHILSSWNVSDLPRMRLVPCHCLFQFYVSRDGFLSCHLYQRSADAFLGLPFNIASYSLLTYMLAHVCSLKPGQFVHSLGDVHIYNNHVSQVREQLQREPRQLPSLSIDAANADLFSIRYEDIKLAGYNPHPTITAPVAV